MYVECSLTHSSTRRPKLYCLEVDFPRCTFSAGSLLLYLLLSRLLAILYSSFGDTLPVLHTAMQNGQRKLLFLTESHIQADL
jgi:hypothetical protein